MPIIERWYNIIDFRSKCPIPIFDNKVKSCHTVKLDIINAKSLHNADPIDDKFKKFNSLKLTRSQTGKISQKMAPKIKQRFAVDGHGINQVRFSELWLVVPPRNWFRLAFKSLKPNPIRTTDLSIGPGIFFFQRPIHDTICTLRYVSNNHTHGIPILVMKIREWSMIIYFGWVQIKWLKWKSFVNNLIQVSLTSNEHDFCHLIRWP